LRRLRHQSRKPVGVGVASSLSHAASLLCDERHKFYGDADPQSTVNVHRVQKVSREGTKRLADDVAITQLRRHLNDIRSELPHFPAPEKPELPRNALDERSSPFSGAAIRKRGAVGNR
jgi:hypothetical protein